MKRENNKNSKENYKLHPERLSFYFKMEIIPLSIVTIAGLIYNVGLTAGPYFEGQLVQKLFDIINNKATVMEMVSLAILYILVILVVQGMRCLKRFYVRRFANDTSRNMREMLYNHLIHESRDNLKQESIGTLMTKAISDVDTCVEGMRKFTTEVFDTGIALLAYFIMMLIYDWRLTLLACVFIPFAYFIAEKVKVVVYRYNSQYKKAASDLNDATMERISGAMTYRVFGQEANRNTEYEKHLKHYERSAVLANIWENTLQPIYSIIAMTGVIFILYFGGKNILGTGHQNWNIAAFTTFLSCFGKMAIKSSTAAKLFNSVQKAQVSWKRIKPFMHPYQKSDSTNTLDFSKNVDLKIKNLSFMYEEGKMVFEGLNLDAKPGDIIGITGPIACGKSTLGKVFLCEKPYQGSILIGGQELSTYSSFERNQLIGYLGHGSELMSASIADNIAMGDAKDVMDVIDLVCMEKDLKTMSQNLQTVVGNQGIRLSGGQQDRLALARTMYHAKKIMILDDPFSAVDQGSERKIMEQMRTQYPNIIFLIISHRVTMFPTFSKVLWMSDQKIFVGNHTELMRKIPKYQKIYHAQTKGEDYEEA